MQQGQQHNQQQYQGQNNYQNQPTNQQNYSQAPIMGQVMPLSNADEKPLLPIKILSYQEALALIEPIPDSFNFKHDFAIKTPCLGDFLGGKYSEGSTFNLPGLGNLIYSYEYLRIVECCRREASSCRCCCSTLDPYKICCPWVNNIHLFQAPTYFIENEKIHISFKDNIGKLYVYGTLLLEFQQCNSNLHDMFAASAQSTMPQMIVYDPFKHSNRKLRVKAQMSICPEHPYSSQGACQSFGGIGYQERKFEITGLSNPNAKCTITNKRTKSQACYAQCGCLDVCPLDSCRFANFPDFTIGFSECTQLEKIGVLLCLIHFNMYNTWAHYSYFGRNYSRLFFQHRKSVY